MTDRFVTVPDSLELPAAVKVGVDRLHDSTVAGRALLTGADAAAQRTSLGLGDAAQHAHGDYATAEQGAKADASDVAALTLTAPLALTVPAGFPAGQVYRVTITQDGTGGHAVTYGGQPVAVDLTAGASTQVEIWPDGEVAYPVTASLSSTYVAQDSNAVNVRDHGAAGDGLADDTAAFVAAIAVSGGADVLVPDGTYIVNTVAVSVNTHLRLSAGATIRHKAASTNHLFVVTATRFSVTGPGVIDGNQANQTARRYAIRAEVPSGTVVTIDRVQFINTQAAAIYGANLGGELVVTRCHFSGMDEHDGVSGNWTCALSIETAQAGVRGMLRFNHNTLIGTDTPAVVGGSPGGVMFAPTLDYALKLGNQSTFEAIGNHFWGIGQHCSVNDIAALHTYPHTRAARFIGNYFEKCGFSAIAAKSVEDFVCQGNVIVDGMISAKNVATEGAISYAPGYHALTPRPRAAITGNIVINPGGESATALQVGIAVIGTAGAEGTDIVVADNVISGVGLAGIKVDRCMGVTLANNIVNGGTAGTAGSDYGIRFDNMSGDVVLTGNRVTSPNGHGLYCNSATSSTARFFLTGNIFEHSGSTTYAVILRGLALVKFTGNHINASAGSALSLTTDGTNKIGHLIWDNSNVIEAGAISIVWAQITKASGELVGTGAPVVTAPKGTTYRRTDGTSGTLLYVNTDGGTGWTAVAEASALAAYLPGAVAAHAGGESIRLGTASYGSGITSDVTRSVLLSPGCTGYNNIIGGDGTGTVGTTTPNVGTAGTGAHASIIGGYDDVAGSLSSKIIADHSYTEVGGEGNNAIFGGANHIARSTAKFAIVAGGDQNEVSGEYSFATGYKNKAQAHSSFVFGNNNVASGAASGATGAANTVSGAYAQAHGSTNTAEGPYSQARGNYAHSRTAGQQALSGGRFAALGDAQTSVLEMHRVTTDATTTTLGIINSTTSHKLLPNQAVAFSCLIVARDTAGTDAAAWKIEGLGTRATGNVLFPTAATVTVLGASAGAATWTAVMGTGSDGGLNTRITGEAGKTIRWVQRMTLAEVLGA